MQNKELREQIKKAPCLICSLYGLKQTTATDPSHILTYATTLKDEAFNIFPCCRIHHHEWHCTGRWTFCEKYPLFKLHLQKLGWTIDMNKFIYEGEK